MFLNAMLFSFIIVCSSFIYRNKNYRYSSFVRYQLFTYNWLVIPFIGVLLNAGFLIQTNDLFYRGPLIAFAAVLSASFVIARKEHYKPLDIFKHLKFIKALKKFNVNNDNILNVSFHNRGGNFVSLTKKISKTEAENIANFMCDKGLLGHFFFLYDNDTVYEIHTDFDNKK